MKLLAPNGKPSNLTPEQYRLVRTPEFISWFGNWLKAYETGNYDNVSKVIDENGEPLVVYHGTKEKFDYFDIKHFGKTDKGFFGKGFYFSTDKTTAESYASISEWDKINNTLNQNGLILELFLNLKKPIIVQTKMDFINASGKREIRESYDGKIVIPNSRYSANTEYIAFHPEQIKLADGTNTTFDSNNPDIRFMSGGNVLLVINERDKDIRNDKDYYPYDIIDEDGRNLGYIELMYRSDLGGYQISNSKVKEKGKGIGKKAYLELIKTLDSPIYSDSSLTNDAKLLWDSLVKNKYAYFDESKGKYRTFSYDSNNSDNKKYQKEFSRRMENWLRENDYDGIQQGGEVVITNLDAIDYVDNFERKNSNNPNIRYAGGGLTDVNVNVSYANEQQINELYDLVSKSNELGNVGYPRLVLIENNKVIGGIFVDNDYLPYEYMFDIFIKKNKRGKGYSKLLLDAMIKDFVDNFPDADQIRGWVINKKLEDYLESKYDFWCADDNEEQILYCYLSKKDAENLLNKKKFMKGGEITLTTEQVEQKLGRKLHWWNDDIVLIKGIKYKKVFLRPEYKIIIITE